jgi:hypothetical protein
LAAHASLEYLFLSHAPLGTPAALDAIVAAALTNRLSLLTLMDCRLCPASAPALARLLGGGALPSLFIVNGNVPILDAAAAAVLGDALRATNCALGELVLSNTAFWRDPAAAVTLLGAVTAHRSLQHVSFKDNPIGEAQDAAGAALGALVAADVPALAYVDLRECGLQEAALGPLVDALPANTPAPGNAYARRSHRQRRIFAQAAAAGFARQHVADVPRDHGHGRGRERRARGAGDREQPRCTLSCRHARTLHDAHRAKQPLAPMLRRARKSRRRRANKRTRKQHEDCEMKRRIEAAGVRARQGPHMQGRTACVQRCNQACRMQGR